MDDGAFFGYFPCWTYLHISAPFLGFESNFIKKYFTYLLPFIPTFFLCMLRLAMARFYMVLIELLVGDGGGGGGVYYIQILQSVQHAPWK